MEAIEAAFDRIIQEKLTSRKKAKGMKQALRKKKQGEDYVPPFLERLQAQFARPDDQTIIRRAVIYAIMAGWAIVQSAQSGPAFQMAISFGLTVFFLHDKRGRDKALLGKAFLNAFVALVIGWLVGSVFPVYIPIFPETWSPELILSLFSFVSFFASPPSSSDEDGEGRWRGRRGGSDAARVDPQTGPVDRGATVRERRKRE